MKWLFAFPLFLLLSSAAFCQSKIDSALLKKILVMFKEDQKWRREQLNLENGKSSFGEATINRNMFMTDSVNMAEAKNIVKKYGFPGYSIVGEQGSDSFWALIQHCDDDVPFQQMVLKLMAVEVKRHNATGEKFALLQDRVLTNQGRKQIYGTQVRIDLKTHHANPFPIADSVHVDIRRKSVGLPPLKDYLKLFDKVN